MRYQIKADVDSIVNMSGTVQDKMAQLTDLKDYCDELFKEAEENIFKNYKYCEKCNKWYHIRAWEHSFNDLENGYGKIDGDICPLGHYIVRIDGEKKGEEENV